MEAAIKSEKNNYFNIGVGLISKDVSDEIFQNFLDIIKLNGHRYVEVDRHLKFQQDEKSDLEIRSHLQLIVDAINQQISELEKQRSVLEGKIATAQRNQEIQSNQAQIDALKKLRDKLLPISIKP